MIFFCQKSQFLFFSFFTSSSAVLNPNCSATRIFEKKNSTTRRPSSWLDLSQIKQKMIKQTFVPVLIIYFLYFLKYLAIFNEFRYSQQRRVKPTTRFKSPFAGRDPSVEKRLFRHELDVCALYWFLVFKCSKIKKKLRLQINIREYFFFNQTESKQQRRIQSAKMELFSIY